MPFTPTHILAILPFAAIKRLPMPFSALAIGSMIPDLPLFVPLASNYLITQSPLGLLTACLPLGLASFLLFQWLLKPFLFALLPVTIQRRCVPLKQSCVEPTPRFFFWTGLAILIGASTHLGWDTFTHGDRMGTRFFPSLNTTALIFRGHEIPIYQVLQIGCTLVGLPLLLVCLMTWLHRQPARSVEGVFVFSPYAKLTITLITAAIPILVFLQVTRDADLSSHLKLSRAITRSEIILLVGGMVASFAFRSRMGARSPR